MIETFIKDLGEIIVPEIDIGKVDQFPVVIREQTNLYAAHNNKNTFWLSYGGEGGISCLRRTSVEFPEFCQGVVDVVRELAPSLPSFGPERVMLIKTGIKGSYWHKDEMLRNSAINIGLKNTNTASTRFALTENPEEYDNNFCEITCQNGRAYLLDTASMHRVYANHVEDYRYLVSISFTESFSDLMRCLNTNMKSS